MKNKWSRLLTLALALIMVLSCFALVGCQSDTPKDPEDPVDPVDPVDPEDPEDPEDPDTDGDYLLSIPKQNYRKTFTFLTDVGDAQVHELYFASEDDAIGNTVDTAIYYRNERVAEHLGVTFESITAPGRWADRGSYINRIAQSFASGDQDFQLAQLYMAFASDGAIQGYYYDVNAIDAIDIDSPWYVQSWLENSLINDHSYMILSDLSYSMWKGMYALCFNKQLADEIGISKEIYALAEDGDLTLDYILAKAELVGEEDGNDVWDQNDTYGLYVTTHTARAMLTFFDIPVTVLNDDDEYEICLYNERTETIYGNLFSAIHDNDFVYIPETATDGAVGRAMFMEDRVLFLPVTLGYTQELRDMTGSFGILPFPKYDADQQEYNSHAQDNFNVFMIPSQTTDPEFCGTVVDALSAESKYSVIPAFYETVLKGRTTKDEESLVMLDIIRDNLAFDFAFIHLTALNASGGGYLWTSFGDTLIKGETPVYKNTYDQFSSAYEAALGDILDSYWDVR